MDEDLAIGAEISRMIPARAANV